MKEIPMEIPQSTILKQQAHRALARGRDPKKLITVFLLITTFFSAFLTATNYWLGLQIDGTSGLSQLGTRAIFSTAQSVLPLIQSFVLMCLELGYLHAMLRISRGQYADHTDLKVGFQRFLPIFRMTLLMGLLYLAIGFATFYLSMQIFTFTPWFDALYTVLMPVVESATVLNSSLVLDDLTLAQATEAMIPMLVIYGVLYGILALILSYKFRMANYALLDQPQAGAIAAMRASSKMMRRNGVKLLKVDLSFWWYYALTLLCTLICYGDMLLPLLGITLPFNGTIAYFLFYGVYLAAVFAVNYFFRNRVEAAYIMAYDAIREKPRDDGVVLGNIFDL